MLIIVGLPVFFLEMLMGQYTGLSSTKIYSRLFPGIRGLGYSMLSIPLIQNFQYCVIMAYSLYYMFMGFRSELPWGQCETDLDPVFSTNNCYTVEEAEKCGDDETFFNKTCVEKTKFCDLQGGGDYYYNAEYPDGCYSYVVPLNSTEPLFKTFDEIEYRASASEEFWYHYILRIAFDNGHLDTEQVRCSIL